MLKQVLILPINKKTDHYLKEKIKNVIVIMKDELRRKNKSGLLHQDQKHIAIKRMIKIKMKKEKKERKKPKKQKLKFEDSKHCLEVAATENIINQLGTSKVDENSFK